MPVARGFVTARGQPHPKQSGTPERVSTSTTQLQRSRVTSSRLPRVRRESGDEDVFPVVVEVGEMAGGGGVAEVEIPVEVQEGAVIGVQGGGED